MTQFNQQITKQMIQDLKEYSLMNSYYKYNFKTKSEKKIIEENFIIECDYLDEIYYQMNSRIIRKLKLLKLNNDNISKILEKIINNSVQVTIDEFMESKLSQEIAKEIDKEIIKKVKKLADKKQIFLHLLAETSIEKMFRKYFLKKKIKKLEGYVECDDLLKEPHSIQWYMDNSKSTLKTLKYLKKEENGEIIIENVKKELLKEKRRLKLLSLKKWIFLMN